jgi:hypothetical protein
LNLNTNNSERYSGQLLTPSFKKLSNDGKECGFFEEGGATINTANNSAALQSTFWGQNNHSFFEACSFTWPDAM